MRVTSSGGGPRSSSAASEGIPGDVLRDGAPVARHGASFGRRRFLGLAAGCGAGAVLGARAWGANPGPGEGWYERAFYLVHLDHHTTDKHAVGAAADPAETDRLIALSRPDVIQIHAKGNPGWTTYPTKVGHAPPKLSRDVLAVWRDIARRRGYAWSIYYNFGRDGVIMRDRPEWNRVDAGGRLRENALCYHTGVAEGYLWPMIEEEMERYGPDAFWFDGSCFTVATCYCAKCRERFRGETGLDAPTGPGDKGWDEFKEMHRAIYREVVKATFERIRRRNPGCRVTFNWAYGLHMAEEPPGFVDHLTGDTGNSVDRLSAEAHWYDSQPKPFDLMTTGHYVGEAGAFPKPAGQIEQEMAIIAANGGRYHLWDNPTPESGLVPERHEFFGRVVAPFLRARQPWCLGTRRVPAVSVLHTSTHHYAATRNSPSCFPNGSVVSRTLRGASEALVRAHADYELISRERLLRGEIGTGVLIAEDLAGAKKDEVAALRAFAESGGTLLLTGGGLRLDGLAELGGLSAAGAMPAGSVWWAKAQGGDLPMGIPLWRSAPKQDLGVTTVMAAECGGESLALVTRRPIGGGSVVAVLVPVFSLVDPKERPSPGLEPFRAWLLDLVAPRAMRPVTTDAPPTVEMVLRRRDGQSILHLVNRAEGSREKFPGKHVHWKITGIPEVAECRVSLRLASRPSSVVAQPGGLEIKGWAFDGGMLQFRCPRFAIHQMVVVSEESAGQSPAA